MTTPARLAVWGDPISHSRSPQLHSAAYGVLGLDWRYDSRRVSESEFSAVLAGLDDSWRGLSLTMPLKEQAFQAAVTRDRHAELTGAVNTLLLSEGPAGFNTDVGGIIDALTESDIAAASVMRILGGGATAASALVAGAELGAQRVEIRARRPERARALVGLGERLGVAVVLAGFDEPASQVDLTVATLPSGTVLDDAQSGPLLDGGGALFEAAYAPWPSALAARWQSGPIISGLAMLLHQAVRQVRVFSHGDPQRPLDEEDAVRQAMRAVLGAN